MEQVKRKRKYSNPNTQNTNGAISLLENVGEVNLTFSTLWNCYAKWILKNIHVLAYGGHELVAVEPFPLVVYEQIWSLLYPGKRIAYNFSLVNGEIEKLCCLFGRGQYFDFASNWNNIPENLFGGWCHCRSDPVNSTYWWITAMSFAYSFASSKLTIKIFSKHIQNGTILSTQK
jgi:hypothetical protein